MTVESAIPAHLVTDRTRTRRIPDDYAPPYPSFVARSSTQVKQIVMAYFGLQGDGPTEVLDVAFAAADGPGHHDRAQGDGEIVSIAYWDDPAGFCLPSSTRPQPRLVRRS